MHMSNGPLASVIKTRVTNILHCINVLFQTLEIQHVLAILAHIQI